MLDLRLIVSDTQRVRESLGRRGAHAMEAIVEKIVALDQERRESLQRVETLKHRRNEASAEIARLKKEKKDAESLLAEMKIVADSIKGLDDKVADVEESLRRFSLELPNLLDPSVPGGKSSEQNVEVRRSGEPRKFSFPVRSHDEIGEKLQILDFKKAGEVTGSRFVFLKGMAARLERALTQFMLDTHGRAGYEEFLPPFMIHRDSLIGTGQLPKFEEDVFKIERFDYFLSPTAEVPITNYHRNEILDEKALPKHYVAYAPCFRSEAGSYGKDTKGLKRQHQFDKVELVKFCTPENSMKELESLVADAEKILTALQLPYRVMLLCGGDTGFAAAKTFDIEVWSPYLKAYMEISSCSNCTDFQARRANIRYRETQSGKVQFAHTLNGSGLAVGRTLLALLENYQREDGSFDIPPILQPYLR